MAIVAFDVGNPEFVDLPKGYDKIVSNYAVMNRVGSAAVAKMHANEVAVASFAQAKPAAPGSAIVMEVYKPKADPEGKPVFGADGVNVPDKLTAIAVMARRGTWPGNFSEGDRVGTWDFAICNPDRTPKENKLECVTCHTPLGQQDFLFSYDQLMEFAK